MPDDIAPELDQEATRFDHVRILDGASFLLCDPRGDVHEGAPVGFFNEDTRYLSRFVLTLNGAYPTILTSGPVDFDSAAFYLTNPELPGVPVKSVSLQRFRLVNGGLRETILLRNHLGEPLELVLRLSCGVDFADVFEVRHRVVVKSGRAWTEHDPAQPSLVFAYENPPFAASCRIIADMPAAVEGDDLVFSVDLPPRGRWETQVRVAIEAQEQLPETARVVVRDSHREPAHVDAKWGSEIPALDTDWIDLRRLYERSVRDLAALRFDRSVRGVEFSLPAAGLPWFMAVFGRDTLITAFMALPFWPQMAQEALGTFAALQGTEVNDYRDEEPGKIIHELRFGELTEIGLRPHRPYYGSVDATILWLILLSEYHRWTGDDAAVRELHGNAMRALAWIDEYGDRDGDGYVEYKMRSAQGLKNQSWKDSFDSMRFRSGEIAEAPIAGCEVQGYVFDAKVRCAELAEQVWQDAGLAARLRTEAAELAERFNREFWIDDLGGYYAIALDADKRKVDAVASNMGHLLWSGIVPEGRIGAVASHLMSDRMFGGWGVRTMAEDEVAYNPISYHNGSVWPHDNALIAWGLARAGCREEALRIAVAQLDASAHFAARLPELFAGYTRSHCRFPVRYPTACSPQAWSAASVFLWIRAMLGWEPAASGVREDALLPPGVRTLGVSGVRTPAGPVDAGVAHH